ncbi:glycoside hydrolase family 25 protein [Williamsia serinedens]|uniref:Lyzozyme M1 (1,4-beta-N-acetylmuramidase), GH25 family n=1 Tax=Williamsia serinedens TaxID=391736 RepID=A0ABT1H1Y3_9NOCA|nr:glycoside hydrolase family 25 protein [Williamsia serinedens]MCP2161239.1 Lyzozyme M1 (1,4-beta-N-acetylmuramidase), GH25 family [Williamsia serinedens]
MSVRPCQRPARRVALIIVALAAALGLSCGTAQADTGPDVSSWQHPNYALVDWFAVKRSGQDFAMVKATEGLSYVNPWFVPDSIGMRLAGLARGTYHYADPSLPAAPQAAFFAAVTLGQNGWGDLPPVLDLERTGGLAPGALIAWTQQYLDTVSALTGRTPIIYTYPTFWRTAMANTSQFTRYPLWIADYNGRSAPGPLPGGWRSWTFWQYTDSAVIPGVPVRVDKNVYSGAQGPLGPFARM